MHRLVLARTRRRDRTTLRFVRSSSSALPRPVYDGLSALFGVPVLQAYGMTEATHQMTCNPLPPGSNKPGSVGVPAGIEVAILGKENAVLPPGENGEVAVRGETVIDGYENNPEANRSSFTDGWFRTGDEGHLDEDGYLFLTGRLKEQINRGGEKISPIEVEEVILAHPAVAEAVVFALPDDKLGEESAAMIVLAPDQALSDDGLRSYLSERLAAFKIPRRILFSAEIPKGPTGKVQRIGMAERIGLTGT
jgi:acyl-CoA synthetase (AMP-forming)/AMP-acid ligase II